MSGFVASKSGLQDGNGRTAFLFANWILHRAGAPVPVDLGQQVASSDQATASRLSSTGKPKPEPRVNRFQASLWAYDASVNEKKKKKDHDSSLMWVPPPSLDRAVAHRYAMCGVAASCRRRWGLGQDGA